MNESYREEMKLIRALRRMGAMHIELPLVKVTFPEQPVLPAVEPTKLMRLPPKAQHAVEQLASALVDEDPGAEVERARQELASIVAQTVD